MRLFQAKMASVKKVFRLIVKRQNLISKTVFFLFEVNVRIMCNKAGSHAHASTHKHTRSPRRPRLFCCFSLANMWLMICHLMFHFWWCLCSGCLIWVLNKLPRPRSHASPPRTSLPPFPSLLFSSAYLLSFWRAALQHERKKNDSHRQRKKKHLLVFKDERLCSPSTPLQDVVFSHLTSTVVFAFSLTKTRLQ